MCALVMRLTAADVIFFRHLNERCRSGIEGECRSAREVRRVWIKSKLEQGAPLSEFRDTSATSAAMRSVRSARLKHRFVRCCILTSILLSRAVTSLVSRDSQDIRDFITEFETKGRLLPDGRAALTTMGVEPTRDLEFVSQRSRSRQRPSTAILIMTGSESNGNNFNAGVTWIRTLFCAASRKIEEYHNVTTDEVPSHC